MIVVDTSVWIEFLRGNPVYFTLLKAMMEKQEILAVEPVFGELLQGARNRRETDIITGYWTYLPKATVNDGWIRAGVYSAANKLPSQGVGLIDAYILTAAMANGAKIWTLDKKLAGALPRELQFAFTPA